MFFHGWHLGNLYGAQECINSSRCISYLTPKTFFLLCFFFPRIEVFNKYVIFFRDFINSLLLGAMLTVRNRVQDTTEIMDTYKQDPTVCVMYKNVFRIEVSQQYLIQFWLQNRWYKLCGIACRIRQSWWSPTHRIHLRWTTCCGKTCKQKRTSWSLLAGMRTSTSG